jgi:hypothetical protein
MCSPCRWRGASESGTARLLGGGLAYRHCPSCLILFKEDETINRKQIVTLFILVALLLSYAPIIGLGGMTARADAPDIDIWYGLNQRFGHIGDPQPWANILGNVSGPDGVASLVYSLNGDPEVTLSIGPDSRRLQSAGDFNVDIDVADLINGTNQVVITATNNLSEQSVETVTVEYTAGNDWPLPYSIDWSSATSIEDVAQVVDGLWELETDSVRTSITGYDRLVALGETSWDDYEVTVPITIHNMPSGGGVGILLRWDGHILYPAGSRNLDGFHWVLYVGIAAIDWKSTATMATLLVQSAEH